MAIITPSNWQVIYGKFEQWEDSIIFHGEKKLDPDTQQFYPRIGSIMSDQLFTGGSLAANISFSNAEVVPSVQFVIYRNAIDDSLIRIGLEGGEFGEAARMSNFVVVIYDGSKPTDRISNPARSKMIEYGTTESFELKVLNVGSIIDIYVNNVLVLRHPLTTPLPRSQCGIWCRSASDVAIRNFRLDQERKRAFIVMQFSEPYDLIYRDVLKPVAERIGLNAERADEVSGPGFIVADIIRQIQQAEVIIADITPENQNVFYEIGYAHAIGKPTILLAEKGKKLPFDVSGMRVLFYENSISGKKQLEDSLQRHLAAVLNQ